MKPIPPVIKGDHNKVPIFEQFIPSGTFKSLHSLISSSLFWTIPMKLQSRSCRSSPVPQDRDIKDSKLYSLFSFISLFFNSVQASLLAVFYKYREIKLYWIIMIVPSRHILTAPTHYLHDYSFCTYKKGLSTTRQHLHQHKNRSELSGIRLKSFPFRAWWPLP